jgi:hypothetical protein
VKGRYSERAVTNGNERAVYPRLNRLCQQLDQTILTIVEPATKKSVKSPRGSKIRKIERSVTGAEMCKYEIGGRPFVGKALFSRAAIFSILRRCREARLAGKGSSVCSVSYPFLLFPSSVACMQTPSSCCSSQLRQEGTDFFTASK